MTGAQAVHTLHHLTGCKIKWDRSENYVDVGPASRLSSAHSRKWKRGNSSFSFDRWLRNMRSNACRSNCKLKAILNYVIYLSICVRFSKKRIPMIKYDVFFNAKQQVWILIHVAAKNYDDNSCGSFAECRHLGYAAGRKNRLKIVEELYAEDKLPTIDTCMP